MVKIVHLTDLHFMTEEPLPLKKTLLKFSYVDKNADTALFTQTNAERIFNYVSNLQPDHIIITGDVTTTGHKDEFENVKISLLELQEKIKPKKATTDKLDPKLFTIIPGNHDIVDDEKGEGRYSKMGRFLKHFGETIPQFNTNQKNYDSLFPFKKKLGDNIILVCINSTNNSSVQKLWRNAIGEIDDNQLKKLPHRLKSKNFKFKIVTLHHHPLPLPYRDVFEKWRILRNAKRFLYICYLYNVNLILHGHKHQPFMWESNPNISGLDRPQQISILGSGAPTVEKEFAKNIFYALEEMEDTKGRICLRLKNYIWNDVKEDFEEKPGPFIGRKDIIELIDQHPDFLERTLYLEKYHEEILESSEILWANSQRFDYQIKEYVFDLKITDELTLNHRREVTLTGSSHPEKNPITMIGTSITGEPSIEYRELELTVKSDRGKDIPYYPCIDRPQEKRIIIFFTPEIKNGKDIRKYIVECKWPEFWTTLFGEGKYPIRVTPRSEGTIEKLLIRLTLDKKVEKEFPEIECEGLSPEGSLTSFMKDNEGNKYCEWTMNHIESNKTYTLNIRYNKK